MVRKRLIPGAFRRASVRSSLGRRASGSEAGYNLVVLIVAITLLHIALVVALPLWSTAMQREREEEAIFRGLQYAEALRVFRERFGRYPTELKELIELEPRSIRQLWTDPLSDKQETGFGLLVETARRRQQRPNNRGGDARNRRSGEQTGSAGRDRGPNTVALDESVRPTRAGGRLPSLTKVPPRPPDSRQRRFRARATSTGPIRGVYIANDGTAIKMFQDTASYEDWIFTDRVIPVPDLLIGALPVVNSDWIGRPFAIDVSAAPQRKREELGGRRIGDRSDRRNRRSASRSQPGRSSPRDKKPGRRRPR